MTFCGLGLVLCAFSIQSDFIDPSWNWYNSALAWLLVLFAGSSGVASLVLALNFILFGMGCDVQRYGGFDPF
jgi:hypothetical protein